MVYDPKSHNRRSIRLKGYDYSQAGAYFVNLLTWERESLFGEIVNGEMRLNLCGQIAAGKLNGLALSFDLTVDTWVIMPNHIHMVVILAGTGKGEASVIKPICMVHNITDASPLPIGTMAGSLGAVIQNYKSVTARRINSMRGTPGNPVWHRNYYERIIRNDAEWGRIHEYIISNPSHWIDDPVYRP